MKYMNIRAFIRLLVVISTILWVFMLLCTGTKIEEIGKSAQLLTTVITIDAVLWLLFVKWAWKFRIWRGWLYRFPNLEGTWVGLLRSDWISPEIDKKLDAIHVVLVIKQSFITISCKMFTSEMISHSYVAEFNIDPDTNTRKITFSYLGEPRAGVRYRSEIRHGTARLEIITKPIFRLNGEYWTNIKTTGEIDLSFRTKECWQCFPTSIDW